MKSSCVLLVLLLSTINIVGQSTPARGQAPKGTVQVPPFQQEDFISNRPANTPTSRAGEEYLIGKDDLIEVTVFEVPELSATPRVTPSGSISLPLLGPIDVAGHTPQEVERKIEEGLKKNYINDPHVTVFVREYASQPVSVLGAVRLPGIYQIKGQKYLLDMLAMAQGLDQTSAGKTIQVLRRSSDASQPQQSISVSTEDLFQNGKTELNIPIQAGDVINVLQSGSIFVVGEVLRQRRFVHKGTIRHGSSVRIGAADADHCSHQG